MDKWIELRSPETGIGDTRELSASFDVPPFDLYGRRHEVSRAEATVRVTRLAEGLHLDSEVVCDVTTSCDRTLDPATVRLSFGESELLSGPHDDELFVEDWKLNVSRYARETLPNEVPMQVFCPGTTPVEPAKKGDEIDPRWQGLSDIASSF